MKKTRKDANEEIMVPEEINLELEKETVIMRKDNKELRKTADKEVKIKKEGNKIILFAANARRNEKRRLGTFAGHLKNMVEGLMNGFEYDLEICNVHFPMTVTFDKTKSEFIIKNLLGEKHPRIMGVRGPVEVEIKAPNIKVKSFDIEAAGQAASRLERLALIRYRDRNKFQDGIFITKKPGKSYL